MPLYEYQCRNCQKITEVRHGFDDAPPQECPSCGGPLERRFNAAGIVFKGSGFYVNDSRKPSSSGGSSTSSSSSSGKSDSSTEKKPEPTSTSETKSDTGSAKSDTASSKSDTAAA